MKKIKLLPFLLFLTISQILHAQNKNSIAISYSLAGNSVFRTANLDGAGSHEGKSSNIFEIFYLRPPLLITLLQETNIMNKMQGINIF